MEFSVFFRQKQQAFVIIQDLLEQCLHNKAPNGRGFMNLGRETNLKLKSLNLNLSDVSNISLFLTKAIKKDKVKEKKDQ